MHKLCRQVSIESPGPIVKDCVFSFVIPVPDTPDQGARVKVNISLVFLIKKNIFSNSRENHFFRFRFGRFNFIKSLREKTTTLCYGVVRRC